MVERLTGCLVPIEQEESILSALKKDDLTTLVQYPQLYPYLRHAYPTRAYTKALIPTGSIPAFQECLLTQGSQLDLRRILMIARSQSDLSLLYYLYQCYPHLRNQ